MDNGSKAIIIAGTILIVIFVATFIIIFFSRAENTTELLHNENIGSDVLAFNTQFSIYGGKNKTKSEVVKLLSKVNANNKTSGHRIDINNWGMGASGLIRYDSGDFKCGNGCVNVKDNGTIQFYEIRFVMDKDGRIYLIYIEKMP